jgi:hypothetical protein
MAFKRPLKDFFERLLEGPLKAFKGLSMAFKKSLNNL